MAASLKRDGAVRRQRSFSFADLESFAAEHRVLDISRLDPKRKGDAITLSSLLATTDPVDEADYITLHAARDDFHASLPLAAVRDRAVVVYRLHGAPLPESAGGPFRFFIPDHAACHAAEIDDCANVKFVDRIELSVGKGRDNRPQNDADHESLHRK